MRSMQELQWAASGQLFRVDVYLYLSATGVMSDLADAVFGGQLLGHVIAGEELTTSVITDAAMTAELAAHMVVDGELSPTEHQIMQAKVANYVDISGHYDPSHVSQDWSDSQIASDLVDQ